MARRNPLVKVAFAIVGVGVLAYLFASTLRDVSSVPYTVPVAALRGWTVELDPPLSPDSPLLTLRPPAEFGMSLFDQVFMRTMESYATPANPGIMLMSRREYDESLAGAVAPADLQALAEREGLMAGPLVPHCMAVHRTSGGREQRLFFVVFDLPAFAQFREAVADRAGGTDTFDPDALAPALLVAASDASLLRQQVPLEQLKLDCEAPVHADAQN